MSYIQIGHWQVFDETGRRKYVSGEEGRRFLLVADGLAPEMRALCYVLSFTGCRISEALDLSRHQLDPERGTLTFRTLKRRRLFFRTVPIPHGLAIMLLALPPRPCGHFWRMHRVTAWRQITRAMKRVGIQGPMACPRGLRHGFGIKAADSAVPPPLIQRWMGHSSLEMSFHYVDAVGAEELGFAKRMWPEAGPAKTTARYRR